MPTTFTRLPDIDDCLHKARVFLAAYGIALALFCLSVVLAHYVVSAFQPVRWPTKTYFLVSLFLALASRKWSTVFVIFCLPLLPELHLQAEQILKPAVKYFVGYAGVDVIAGFCIGQGLRSWFIDKTRSNLANLPLLWPLGLVMLMISSSVAVAISRNVWQSGSSFSVVDLFDSLLKFKFLARTDNYYPVADLIVFGVCTLFVLSLLSTLRQRPCKDELIFKPILWGLLISASWGIFQALTRFGLPANTYAYRPESFGFGTQGFQPDLHAFAGHMLLGAVGILGLIRVTESSKLRNFAVFVCAICWIALILSKSRASLMFAILGLVIFAMWMLKNQSHHLNRRVLFIFSGISVIISLVVATNSHEWIFKYYELVQKANFSKIYNSILRGDFSIFGVLNSLSSERLELHGAALRMGFNFPLFGIGQGNFFRLSSILEFSGSPFMVNRGGENAHNYFLQTFAEVGLLGIFCFGLVFIWPVLWCAQREKLVPVIIAILSIFAGNLYSHSLVIRENLFLLAALLALLMSFQNTDTTNRQELIASKRSTLKIIAISVVVGFLLMFTSIEVKNSFNKMPFNTFYSKPKVE